VPIVKSKLPFSITVGDFKAGRFTKQKIEIEAEQGIVLTQEEINSSTTIQRLIRLHNILVSSDTDNLIIFSAVKQNPSIALTKPIGKKKEQYSKSLNYPILTKSDQIELRWGGIFDSTGYGEMNKELVTRLTQKGIRIKVSAFKKQFNELDEQTVKLLTELERTKLKDPDKAAIVACFVPQSFSVNQHFKGYRIGYTMFESSGLWKDYVMLCNTMDEIWVPSVFNLITFKQGEVEKPIRIIPLGIDIEKFNPNVKPLIEFKDQFVFLFVGTWSLRKGYDVLLKAFLQEFSISDPVTLLIKSSYKGRFDKGARAYIYGEIAEMIKKVGKRSNSPRIKLYEKLIPRDQMPQLYKSVNVFVLPSRGEGWSMPTHEAMAVGIPVITTRWSGPLDFAYEDNSFLIDTGKVRYDHQLKQDSVTFERQGFIEPNVDHLCYLMRRVYTNYQEAKERAEKARKNIEQNFTWNHTVNKILIRLGELYGR